MWIVTAERFDTGGGAIGVVYPATMCDEEVEEAANNIPHIPKGTLIRVFKFDCATELCSWLKS